MRNLLAFTAAATLTIAGVGWYLGWYKIESTALPSGNRNLNIEIDSEKIGEDLHKGKIHLLQKSEAKIHETLENSRKDESDKHAESNQNNPSKQEPNQ